MSWNFSVKRKLMMVPFLRWIKDDLSSLQRKALGVAMRHVLQRLGQDVCSTRFGRTLAKGIFEFRLQESAEEILFQHGLLPSDSISSEHERILLRVFCHAHGNKIILLLHGYDKSKGPNKARKAKEIAETQKRLKLWQRGNNRTH